MASVGGNSELEVCVSDRKLRALGLRIAVPLAALGCGSAAALMVLPTGAGAATLVTPASLTNCFGSLKASGSGFEQLGYTITCNTNITAYTVFVVRQQDAGNNIQQYASNPSVVYPSTDPTPGLAGTVSSEAVTCEGVTPSDGVNCYAQALGSDNKTPVLGAISAFYSTQGTISLDEPYCKFLPKGAKPGTPAVPKAIVEYVVTDDTGAEDGPFVLNLKGSKCPKVANAVPAKATTKPAKKKHAKRKTAIRRGRVRAAR